MYKKGILLTLSFVTLGTILFSVAFLISQNENEAEQGVKEIITLDLLYHKHTYLSNSLREIIMDNYPNTVEIKNNYIEFEIDNNLASNINNSIGNFTKFVELMNEPVVFSSSLESNLDLTIEPFNVTYSHPYDDDNIIFNIKNAIGLNITMNISIHNSTESWTWATSTSGYFNLSAQIFGDNTNEITQDSIDIFSYNLLYINTTFGNLSVKIDNGFATIEKGAKEGRTNTKIFLNSTDVSIVISDAYTISSYNSQFTGDIQIAEN